MAYMITPGCVGPSGETLALAAMANGSIVVQDASEPTSGLWWSLVYDDVSQNFAMISLLSLELGKPAALGLITGGGGTSALTLSPILGGLSNLTTWDVVAGGNALAVRPTLSPSLNLNVSGAGSVAQPGTAVIAWDGWNNGEPNEIWTFQDVGYDHYPWNYSFAPENAQGLLLTANPDDAGGQLTIQPPSGDDETASPLQLWGAQYHIDGVTPLGVIFVNEELSMSVRTTPNGGALFCADQATRDAWSAWLTGPGPDEGMSAVRSVGDQNLYWNVSGGGDDPGNPVISYPWQGGATNEQWVMQFVPHEVT